MTKQLEITPEIHQAWIDVEKQIANFYVDNHAAVTSRNHIGNAIVIYHNHIGNAIYGENLDQVKTFIYENSNADIEIKDLDHLEVL